jgi:WD40 repeat protein
MIVIFAIVFSFLVAVFTSSTQAMNNNVFDKKKHCHLVSLQKVLEPIIEVFITCRTDLQAKLSPDSLVRNFQAINSAWTKLYKVIKEDQNQRLFFIEFYHTDQIKDQINTIQSSFISFEKLMPLARSLLIFSNTNQKNNIEQVIPEFLKNKSDCDALFKGNFEFLFESGQEALIGGEIEMSKHLANNENLVNQLQQKLSLESCAELTGVQQVQITDMISKNSVNGYLVDDQEIALIESFQPEELISPGSSVMFKGSRIFSGVTDTIDFVRRLKAIFTNVDITKILNKKLFDQLMAQAPSNFSMFMNREIGRVTPRDIMSSCIGQSFKPLYSHYFPECLNIKTRSSQLLQTITVGYHDHSIISIKQLDNIRLACCLSSGSRVIWDLNENKFISSKKFGEKRMHVKQLNDGIIALFSDIAAIKLFDLESNNLIATLDEHGGWIKCLKQLDNGYLASGGMDKSVKLWDLSKKECVATLEHPHYVYCIEQLDNGYLASGSEDKKVRIWDLNTHECILTFECHKGLISSMKKLKNGNLVSCASDGKMMIWNLKAKRLTTRLTTHMHDCFLIRELHDGHLALVSPSRIMIWDLKKEEYVKEITSEEGSFSCIKQLSDGRLVAGLNNGMIKIFSLYDDLSLEQIALVVNLEQRLQKANIIALGDGWSDIFETLPTDYQNRFQQSVRSCYRF